MSLIQQSSVRNHLLRQLSAEDFDLIQPHLRLVPGPLRYIMFEADKVIKYLHFPEQGFTSVTAGPIPGQIEVGMIGREGLVGASPILLGVYRSPHQAYIQMAGANLQIEVEHFEHVVAQSSSLRQLLLRYVQAFLVQTAQTAFANAAFDIEARLARWLLMCQDRTEGNRFDITHEFLSLMLGVRRPGVTLATQMLEGKGLIKARRGHIEIVDRSGLKTLAEDSYGVAEGEYANLIVAL